MCSDEVFGSAPITVLVLAGKGVESLPFHAPHPEEARHLEFFHYTDRAGFEGLTAAEAQWLPSLGIKPTSITSRPLAGWEDRQPPEEVRSADSIAVELSALLTLMANGSFADVADLSSIAHGPGWYVTDLPPGVGTDTLLDHLWGGDEGKRSRTRYWIKIRVSEFKVVSPDRLRPRLQFVPIQDVVGLSVEGSFYGLSRSPVELVSGGSRSDRAGGRAKAKTLCRRGREIVPAFQFLIEGWPRLPESQQESILSLCGVREPVTRSPDSDEGRAVDLLHHLAQSGEYAAALRSSDELTVRYPYVADLWSNRGVILAKLGRRGAAIDCYNRALEIDPDYAQARLNLAASLVRVGKPEQALRCLNPHIARHPKDAEPWFNRGSALMLLREWSAAARSFERFVELAPDHPSAPRARTLARQCGAGGSTGWLGRRIGRAMTWWRRS